MGRGRAGPFVSSRWLPLVVLVLALCGALSVAQAARANVYFPSTPADLQTAINDAASTPGADTINLAAGVYHIGNTIGGVGINARDFGGLPNGITLLGAGASSTILDGDSSSNSVVSVYGSSLITIADVTIQNGTNDGIYDNGDLVLRDSVVRDNRGSGIESVGNGLVLSGDTITRNGNAAPGGTSSTASSGVYVEARFSAVNSTISGNLGWGVNVNCACGGATLQNVTIAGNSLAGLYAYDTVGVTNTIIAGNTGGACFPVNHPFPPFPDPLFYLSKAVSNGNNLVADASCGFAAAGDLVGVDPQLGPLLDNGGPTPTMALAPTSPAIDAGSDSTCPRVDQRGVSRPQGTHCDIGAFEAPAPPPTTPGMPTTSASVTRTGSYTVSWVASTGAAPITYTLEHANASGTWTLVATTLSATSFPVTENEGTWQYRVTAANGSGSSLTSAASAPVVVDGTPPNPPSITPDRLPEDAVGGWYKDTVTLTFTSGGDPALADGSPGSGVDPASLPASQTFTTAGSHAVSGTAKDIAGNESTSASQTVLVDTDAPQVAVTCPAAPVEQGAPASATVSANDPSPGSGLAIDPSGSYSLDTSTPGPKTSPAFTATDRVGHSTSQTCTYIVLTGNTQPGSPVVVSPPDQTGNTPVTLTFSSVTAGGNTTLTTSSTGPTPPAGLQLGSPPVYYNLATTATFAGAIEICISTAGITFVGTPVMYHFEGGAWVDVTDTARSTSTQICGTVTSLSPFALFAPTTATPTARSLKQSALVTATGLLAGASTPDAAKLRSVVKSLSEALDPSRWVDGNHLQAKHGNEVFDREADAVAKLQELLKDKKTAVPATTLQSLIDTLVQADQILATVAIADAVAASGDPQKIAKAQKELAKAADALAKRHFPEAIDHYKNAWHQAEESTRKI